MEIDVKNLRYAYKGKNVLQKISFHFDSSNIIGVMGSGKTLLLEILDLQKKYYGQIFINQELVGFINKLQYQRQIALVPQKDVFFTTTVEEEMKYIMNYYHYDGKDIQKRMSDSLKMVHLSETFLKRRFDTLSNSEKCLAKIACSLLMNPKIILLDEPFVGLDRSSKKSLIKLFQKLRDQKDRLIIIASNDVDLLYEFTDQILILENGTVLRMDDTLKIFRDTSFMENHGFDIPNLVHFTNLAKTRKVKLSYHRDILDLIKDVYKHV